MHTRFIRGQPRLGRSKSKGSWIVEGIPLGSAAKGLAESVDRDASETGWPVSREGLAGGGPREVINFLCGPNKTQSKKIRQLELVCWWGVTSLGMGVYSWKDDVG